MNTSNSSPKYNPQSNERGSFSLYFISSLGAVLLFIFLVAYFFYGLQPVLDARGGEAGFKNLKDGSADVQFKIAKGEGFKEITSRLYDESLIKSVAIFKLYALLTGKAGGFQPGIYDLSLNMSVPEMVGMLTSAGAGDVVLTFPEGLTLKDIDAELKTRGVLDGESLADYPFKTLAATYPYLNTAKSLEGFLFPDTYNFRAGSSAREVLDTFLKNFNAKAWAELKEKNNWYETLILASFLEKEIPNYGDREIVAGLLLKRLKSGMPFQVDATVSYAKCDGSVRNCTSPRITRKDLEISSPYNTYKRLGWTPTPIANPGITAIRAALAPKSSSFWYYLSATDTKETIFSKTLEEHNRNRIKYL